MRERRKEDYEGESRRTAKRRSQPEDDIGDKRRQNIIITNKGKRRKYGDRG